MLVYIIMALESLRDPLSRLSVIPSGVNVAYDANSSIPNDARWSPERQYVQNDIVFLENDVGDSVAYMLTGVTSLLGGPAPSEVDAWQWVSMAGNKPYPSRPSTLSVFAPMPNISFAAWQNAARVGRK